MPNEPLILSPVGHGVVIQHNEVQHNKIFMYFHNVVEWTMHTLVMVYGGWSLQAYLNTNASQ